MQLYKIGRFFAAAFLKVTLWGALAATVLWAVFAYIGLFLLGEQNLVASPVVFTYWLMVTASTVGYGDLSPATPAGMIFTGFFIIPVGLSIFAMLITKIGFILSNLTSRKRRGLGMIHVNNHCVIIGWNASRTLRLIELLSSTNNQLNEKIVLCVDMEMENPLEDEIEFIRVDSFLNEDEMRRARIDTANRVVLDLSTDEETLTTALLCRKLNPTAHKTAYFKDENIGRLLKVHCPQVEVIPSVSIELLARATLDPGSSAFHQQLLDSTEGTSQYSIEYTGEKNTSFGELFSSFKTTLDATLVGIKHVDDARIQINPSLDQVITLGSILYYYSPKRVTIEHGKWDTLSQK